MPEAGMRPISMGDDGARSEQLDFSSIACYRHPGPGFILAFPFGPEPPQSERPVKHVQVQYT
jgi:hypothetical protein